MPDPRLSFEGWLECMGRCALGLYGPIELLKLHHLVDCTLRNLLQSQTIEAAVDKVWHEVRGDIRIWNVEAAASTSRESLGDDVPEATETPSTGQGSKRASQTGSPTPTSKNRKSKAKALKRGLSGKAASSKGFASLVGQPAAAGSAAKGSMRSISGALTLEAQWIEAKDAEQGLGKKAAATDDARARAAVQLQAVVLGRLERRMLTDQMQAAIRIQSVLRGRVARRKLLAERERQKQAKKAKKLRPGSVPLKKAASTVDMKKRVSVRATAAAGARPKGDAKKKKEEEERLAAEAAAIKLQAVARGHRQCVQLKHEEAAAVKLEAAWRGRSARRDMASAASEAAATAAAEAASRPSRVSKASAKRGSAKPKAKKKR